MLTCDYFALCYLLINKGVMMKGKDWETDEGEDRLAKRIIAEALRARAEKIVNRIGPIHTVVMSNWEGDTIYTFYQSAKNW
jgi:predicted GTPase